MHTGLSELFFFHVSKCTCSIKILPQFFIARVLDQVSGFSLPGQLIMGKQRMHWHADAHGLAIVTLDIQTCVPISILSCSLFPRLCFDARPHALSLGAAAFTARQMDGSGEETTDRLGAKGRRSMSRNGLAQIGKALCSKERSAASA